MRPTRLSSNLFTVTTFLSYLASTKAQQLAKRQDEVNYFINPQAAGPNADFSENLNFNLGSVIDISWVTNYPTVSLQLCQQSNQESASCFPLFANQKAITTAKWTVGLGSSGFDLSYSQIFYFYLTSGNTDSGTGFTCHYFNIVDRGVTTTQTVVTATINPLAVAASSTSNAPILQTITMSPAITIQAGIASAAPTSSSTSSASTTSSFASGTSTSNPSSGGLSTGAKIGIGVGVGLAVLAAIVGLLIFFCLKKRRNRRQRDSALQPPAPNQQDGQYAHYTPDMAYQSGFSTDPKYAPVQQFVPHGELAADERPQEMYAGKSPTQELPGSQPFQGYGRQLMK